VQPEQDDVENLNKTLITPPQLMSTSWIERFGLKGKEQGAWI
jgi:cell division inhibitor SulA